MHWECKRSSAYGHKSNHRASARFPFPMNNPRRRGRSKLTGRTVETRSSCKDKERVFFSECSAKAEAATFTCREEKEKYVDRLFTSSLLRVSLEACAQFLLEYFFIVVRPLISVWSFLLKPLVLCKALELQKSLASEILRASFNKWMDLNVYLEQRTLVDLSLLTIFKQDQQCQDHLLQRNSFRK